MNLEPKKNKKKKDEKTNLGEVVGVATRKVDKQ